MQSNRNLAGILLVIAGVVLLLGVILPWGISVFRILLALAVVYIGLNMTRSEDTDGASRETGEDHQRACRYVCSSAALDFTDSAILPERLVIQSVMSSVTVRLPVDVSITLCVSGVLSGITLPDQQNLVLGETTCHCGTQDPSAPRLTIDASCVMGALQFHIG